MLLLLLFVCLSDQSVFAMETVLDDAAQQLGVDPYTLRTNNFYQLV